MASFDTHTWKDVCDYKYTAKDICGVIMCCAILALILPD